jgi:hypothetical protein
MNSVGDRPAKPIRARFQESFRAPRGTRCREGHRPGPAPLCLSYFTNSHQQKQTYMIGIETLIAANPRELALFFDAGAYL